ncbi:MAG TPA: radical SAM protein, partial [Candidatus Hydrogenedentes bacterium]|nr:radical SAM protein [Candidatus Hydrogenedentota bacterium]
AGAGEELAGLPYRTLGVITSRGCPFRCLFCANSTRVAKLRFHSPERVIEEIRFVAERYRIQSIAFYDELMATDQERFCGICHGLIESGLNRLRWECQVHPNAVRADVLPLMKQAGCVQVAIGFESGSQAILDRIGKQATVERNLEVARKVREAGLRLRGCFIMGVPGETVDDIEKTRRFIRDARIDFASMHFLTPYPGTALYLEVADRIAASHIPWSKFTCGDPDTFLCNECIPRDEQKRLFETFSAQLAFHNYSLPDMIRRAIKHPRHALHVAAKLLPWRR